MIKVERVKKKKTKENKHPNRRMIIMDERQEKGTEGKEERRKESTSL